MATSGTIKTNVEYDSYFWVKWSQKSQSVENNTTTINWSCGVYCGHSFYSNAIRMSAVTINGTQKYAGGTYSNYSKGDHTIASGEMTISHNSSDGTKTFTISAFTGWLYSNHNYSAAAEDFTLTTIPRASTLTAYDQYLGTQRTVTVNSASSSFRHELTYACGAHTGTLISKSSTATSASLVTPITWASGNTSGKTLSCTLNLKTYTSESASTAIGNVDKVITLNIPDDSSTKPTVSISVAPVNTGLSGALASLYIQGKSKASVTYTTTTKYNATISEYKVDVGTQSKTGSTSPLTTDFLRTAGTIPVTARVTDSRGFYGDSSGGLNITVLPYSRPSIIPLNGLTEIVCARCTDDGTLSSSGTYLRIRARESHSSLNGNNSCTFKYRCKAVGGSWNSWTTLASITDTYINLSLAIQTAYNVELCAEDSVGESTTLLFDIPTAIPPLHLGAGGKNVGIGRYCNYDGGDNRVDVAWDAYFERGVFIGGSQLLLQSSLQVISDMSLLSNTPTGFSGYGRAIMLGRSTDNDRYYLLIDSAKQLFVGAALNGATTITWALY